MIHNYDIGSADCYDNHSRWFRMMVYILDDLYQGKSIKGAYYRFFLFEIYLGEQSLKRKMNKLYLKGILNDHEST